MTLIHLGADHAGFALKEQLKNYLHKKGYLVKDHGALRFMKEDDYPDHAAKVARAVQKSGKGILICGSAEGICIAANRFRKIRAVAVWTTESARLSREHNDANVLCLSGWQLPLKKAEKIVSLWLATPFSSAERHKRRIRKLDKL